MKVLDLFCGAGGFSAGCESAGYEILAGVDSNEDAVASYDANFGDRGVCADLGDVEAALSSVDGLDDVDVVVGGPPCQGWSRSGAGGSDDARRKLLWSFVEAVELVRPRSVVMENVAALREDYEDTFERLVSRFEAAGYTITAEVLDFREWGVPQARSRLIIVGTRGGGGVDLSPPSGGLVTVEDALDGLPVAGSGGVADHVPSAHSESVVRKYHDTESGGYVHGHRHQRRLVWGEPSGTVTASNADFHPELPRYLTIREQARLQTFSDDHIFEGSKASRQRQVGNAVPPRVAEVLARRL